MTANTTSNNTANTDSIWQTLSTREGLREFFTVKVNALVWSWLGLLALGWVMVMSASTSIADTYTGNAAYFSTRHSIYILLGISVAFFTSRIPISWWQQKDRILLLVGIVGLIAVLIPGIGHEVNGSARWLNLGIMKIQPSEIVKLTVVLYISGYLIRRQQEVQNQWSGFLKPLGILIIIVPLLLMEPDFGSVVVLMGAVLVLLFLGGVKAGQFFLLVVVTLAAGYLIIISEDYRLARLTTYWQPFHPDHVYGSSYQLAQALIAFGRGELWGTGLGESVQKLFYLPEAHTDFVFAIWSEETGLVGGLFALGLLAFFLAQCMIIGWRAQRAGNLYGGFVCFGIATLFGLQVIINLGVNTGLLPTKGLTLPFFSYGGSSLIICCVMVALVYRVSLEVDEELSAQSKKEKSSQSNTKQSRKKNRNKSKHLDANSSDANRSDTNSSDDYETGFDRYVKKITGGQNDE